MSSLNDLIFNDRIIEALRENKLVVFAGAGVSKGSPAGLETFDQLVQTIAARFGETPKSGMPLDRILGELHDRKNPVHEETVRILSKPGSRPNDLHRNLLRLFNSVDRIKLVTTNFDLLFESAAQEVFSACPEIFNAPALPDGKDFSGIVHVHGALPRAKNLILTDKDFGRAYLTEGWARRFLVSLFEHNTVVFVGYSHDDAIMHYLSRAIVGRNLSRFALTEKPEHWDSLGIEPIGFDLIDAPNRYQELYDGVEKLAQHLTRGALNWKALLDDLARREPPVDEESVRQIDHALREVYTTRLLCNVARNQTWPIWLNNHHHLAALFAPGKLSERDRILARWLARHYAIEHPDVVFELMRLHRLALNPELWHELGRIVAEIYKVSDDSAISADHLRRWIVLLLETRPVDADSHTILWLAECSTALGCHEQALRLFFAMAAPKFELKKPWAIFDETTEADLKQEASVTISASHWELHEVWRKCIRPHLNHLAEPLIADVTRQMEATHHKLCAWGCASKDWDSASYGRSAIEPHEQDRHDEPLDVLVNAARESLECLAQHAPEQIAVWYDRHIKAPAPLLRRLAIHAMTADSRLSADARLAWVYNRCDFQAFAEHHEVHRAVALSYPEASDRARQAMIATILAQTRPAHDTFSASECTARVHFDWLNWLLQAKPDCDFARQALKPISTLHPDWGSKEHPDLTHWHGSVDFIETISPWSVEQLLAKPAQECMNDLLSAQPKNRQGKLDREGLCGAVRSACKQRSDWALDLMNALAQRDEWKVDLWFASLEGVSEAEMSHETWRQLLTCIANPQLFEKWAYLIAKLLVELTRDGGKPFTFDELNRANAIAEELWASLPKQESERVSDWLSRAINRPAGKITEFRIQGLSIFLQGKTGTDRVLPETYRKWFAQVVEDSSDNGGMGRCLLAAHAAFLFSLDAEWTRENVIPLFSDSDDKRFHQAWDGYLVWGRLYAPLVAALRPAFLAALARLPEKGRNRERFIEFYAAIAVFIETDPLSEWIPAFFKNGIPEDRTAFARDMEHRLRRMEPTEKHRHWDRWLKRYWENRLNGIPVLVNNDEIHAMLGWMKNLDTDFPDAVTLIERFRTMNIGHSWLIMDLSESDLVTRYPESVARLLIYLCKCNLRASAKEIQDIISRLTGIPASVRTQLDDALVRNGFTDL